MELEFRDDSGVSKHGVPYTGLSVTVDYGLDISIRQYPKRTFISYEDDRGNQSSGADLDDCWLAPTVIYAKIPNRIFNFGYLDDLFVHLGYAVFQETARHL